MHLYGGSRLNLGSYLSPKRCHLVGLSSNLEISIFVTLN